MRLTAKELMVMYDDAVMSGESLRGIWSRTQDFTSPSRSTFYNRMATQTSEGETYNNLKYLYDNTAVIQTFLTASVYHSLLTNPHGKWFRYAVVNEADAQEPQVKRALELLENTAHKLIKNSNFHGNIYEIYLDFVSIGNGIGFLEASRTYNKINFQAISPYDVYFLEGDYGYPEMFFRKIMTTPLKIKQKFARGKKGDELSSIVGRDIEEMLKSSPREELEIVHIVYPNNNGREGIFKKKYTSVYICKDTKKILEEKDLSSCPYVPFRGLKEAGDVYGVGWGTYALPVTKTANPVGRAILLAANKAAEPPILAKNVTKDTLDMSPGGITEVVDDGDVSVIHEVKLNDLLIFKEGLRNDIKASFFDNLINISRGQYETATATQNNAEIAIRLLSPFLGRLEHETLQPIVETITAIMKKDEVELGLEEAFSILSDVEWAIEFASDIARAQTLKEADELLHFTTASKAVAELVPESLDNINGDEIIQKLADHLKVTRSAVNEPDKVNALRQQRAREAEVQRQADLRNQNTKTASDASNILKNVQDLGGEAPPEPAETEEV